MRLYKAIMTREGDDIFLRWAALIQINKIDFGNYHPLHLSNTADRERFPLENGPNLHVRVVVLLNVLNEQGV
jgi:hypothetical protein